MTSTGPLESNPFTLVMARGSAQEPIIAPWKPAELTNIPSFGLESTEQPAPVWHVELPAGGAEAQAILQRGRRLVEKEEQALTQSFLRLEQLTSELASPGPHELQGTEAELIATLAQTGPLQPVMFDVNSGSTVGLADSVRTWLQESWAAVQSLISRTTWTETAIDGRLIARSALGRTGDTLTVWRTEITSEEAALHNRAVKLALASKQAVLRKLTLVIQGALMVTGLIAAPGSALLAIPAVWRFLNQLRAELIGE